MRNSRASTIMHIVSWKYASDVCDHIPKNFRKNMKYNHCFY